VPRSVPLSVRVHPDDATFIADLDIAGAHTPSDKVRAIIAEARRRAEGSGSYAETLSLVQDTISPALQLLRAAENRQQIHSDLIFTVAEWIPDTLALLMSSFPLAGDEDENVQLEQAERSLADRVFRLLETVLRMGVTERCRGYDPDVVSRRMGPALELAEVIRSSQHRARKENA